MLEYTSNKPRAGQTAEVWTNTSYFVMLNWSAFSPLTDVILLAVEVAGPPRLSCLPSSCLVFFFFFFPNAGTDLVFPRWLASVCHELGSQAFSEVLMKGQMEASSVSSPRSGLGKAGLGPGPRPGPWRSKGFRSWETGFFPLKGFGYQYLSILVFKLLDLAFSELCPSLFLKMAYVMLYF